MSKTMLLRANGKSFSLAIVAGAGMAALLSLGVAPASAALVTHESFDQTPGSIHGKTNTSAGWSASSYQAYGSGAPQVVSGSLSDPTGTLVTSGNKMTASVIQNATWSGTVFGAVANSTGLDFNKDGTMASTSTVRWASVLLRKDSANADATFGIEMGDTYQYVANLRFGVINGVFGAGIAGAQANSSTTPVVGTTYFLALKFDWTSGAKPKLTLFVNPVPGPTAPADATGYSGTTSGNYGWGNYNTGLANFTGSPSINMVGKGYTIDELRFGDTFADVAPVPEPASIISLMGVGGLALLRRKRRS